MYYHNYFAIMGLYYHKYLVGCIKDELMEDEKQKLQNEIKRDSPENKLKDFLLWTESKLKNYTHTVSIFCTYCL